MKTNAPADGSPGSGWRRHLHVLLALNLCNLIQSTGGKFVVVLVALHQQASPVTIGLLVGLHSLVPALTSVAIGRVLDKKQNLRMSLVGSSVVTTMGTLLPFFWEHIAALFVFSVVTGSAFNVFRIGGQQLTGLYGKEADRVNSYNLYSQCLAVGNLVSPLLGGFAIDHLGPQKAFLILSMLSLPAIAVLLSGRLSLPANQSPMADDPSAKKKGLVDLVKSPKLRQVLVVCVVLMGVWDMFTFAWPIYGSHLQFSASEIGIVSSVFYSGTLVVRALVPKLLRHFTQWQLLLLAMLISSGMLLAFAFISQFAMLVGLALLLGLVLGLIQPMTMSLVFQEAPSDRKGEVLGLRMTMVFTLHIVIPLLSGLLVASALGIASIWYAATAVMLIGAWYARDQWRYKVKVKAK